MHVLGIDYGSKRIGLAYGDDVGVAIPLQAANQPTPEERMTFIAEVVASRRIEKFVVGYPYNMDGTVGFKAREVDAFIAGLEKRFGLTVERVDETLTSFKVEQSINLRALHEIKDIRRKRATGEVDSSAAAIILQDYLDTALGLPPVEE